MSSLPHLEGAKQLLSTWRQLVVAKQMRAAASRLLADTQQRITKLDTDIHELERGFDEALDKMDCNSPGNFGWRGRASALFVMILEQLDEAKVQELRKVAMQAADFGFTEHRSGTLDKDFQEAFEAWWKDLST